VFDVVDILDFMNNYGQKIGKQIFKHINSIALTNCAGGTPDSTPLTMGYAASMGSSFFSTGPIVIRFENISVVNNAFMWNFFSAYQLVNCKTDSGFAFHLHDPRVIYPNFKAALAKAKGNIYNLPDSAFANPLRSSIENCEVDYGFAGSLLFEAAGMCAFEIHGNKIVGTGTGFPYNNVGQCWVATDFSGTWGPAWWGQSEVQFDIMTPYARDIEFTDNYMDMSDIENYFWSAFTFGKVPGFSGMIQDLDIHDNDLVGGNFDPANLGVGARVYEATLLSDGTDVDTGKMDSVHIYENTFNGVDSTEGILLERDSANFEMTDVLVSDNVFNGVATPVNPANAIRLVGTEGVRTHKNDFRQSHLPNIQNAPSHDNVCIVALDCDDSRFYESLFPAGSGGAEANIAVDGGHNNKVVGGNPWCGDKPIGRGEWRRANDRKNRRNGQQGNGKRGHHHS
jgi:hypothetical protein